MAAFVQMWAFLKKCVTAQKTTTIIQIARTIAKTCLQINIQVLTREPCILRIRLVYVTAFPNRSLMGRYLGEIAWETEVWVADSPSHLIHFNGVRFLGPY